MKRITVLQELKMTPESKTYEAWSNSPVPIYIEFFFFNWTNQDSLKLDGQMHIPQLQELGPYRFKWVPDDIDLYAQLHTIH